MRAIMKNIANTSDLRNLPYSLQSLIDGGQKYNNHAIDPHDYCEVFEGQSHRIKLTNEFMKEWNLIIELIHNRKPKVIYAMYKIEYASGFMCNLHHWINVYL